MNWFGKISCKADTSSYKEITTVSNIKQSSVEIIVNHYHASHSGASKEDLKRAMEKYLHCLLEACAGLDWFDQVDYRDEKAQRVKLDHVYTALLTTTLQDAERDGRYGAKTPYSAVEMLDRHDKLVIAGAPGSGKSALVNFVTLCMAGELLQHPQCNLQRLTQPLPDDHGKPRQERQQWRHGALLPLRIVLRDFACSAHFPGIGQEVGAQPLLDFIRAELDKATCQDYYPLLQNCLDDGGVLVMFDGLDEVPEADKRRETMKKCIDAFRKAHGRNRFLITVRPYAYQEARWKIPQFTETALANFSRGQICLFIDLWYQDYDGLDAETVAGRTQKLKDTIFAFPALHELAERPLLLTLMAFLDRNRHDLPRRRAALYQELLDLLVKKWEKARFAVNDSGEAERKYQPSLSAFLQVGYDAILLMLQRLAFNAHAGQQSAETGVADIGEGALVLELHKLVQDANQDNPPNALLLHQHLRDRVGILNLRGGDHAHNAVYCFPHRSFQEYLAASYL
ncbi:MAG: NACHT domain-containing protein, partial [Gammaproteobacteria bacterium]